ncbi:MAG: Uma2 family endonuclease [Verrucomicrobiota bacterium]|jgi:Uma2 family endonuclease
MTVAEAPKAASSGPHIWPLSVKAYHALGELGLIPQKTELLYGQVIHKMWKSPYHSFLQQFLTDAIQAALPPGIYLRSEQPFTCPDSEPEPDLAIVRGCKEDYRHEHPRTAELVIEVCVSSYDYDRSKLRACASAGVKEVWFVLAPENQIEVHRQPAGEQFAEHSLHGQGGRLASVAVPSFAVDLDALFAKS